MKAVIPVAGLGTRLYPMTRVVSKPFLPLFHHEEQLLKPAIHFIVEEALNSGVEGVCIVVSPSQRQQVREYFLGDLSSPSLLPYRHITNQIKKMGKQITIVTQDEPMGFGHAIYCARKVVGNKPFAVFLGDHVYTPSSRSLHGVTCGRFIISAFHNTNCSITSVGTCHESELNLNGILKCEEKDEKKRIDINHTPIMNILEMREKPTLDFARNNLISSSRKQGEYFCNFGIDVLSPSIFNILEYYVTNNKQKEVQLREAMKELWKTEGLKAVYMHGSTRHDFGIPTEYRKTFLYMTRKQLKCSNSQYPASIQVEVEKFMRLLEDHHSDFFSSTSDVYVSRSPGRLDVMGGIADYSGSTVVQLTTKEATFVALQIDSTGNRVQIRRNISERNSTEEVNLVTAATENLLKFQHMSYPVIHHYFKSHFVSTPWLAYICGVIIVLGKEIDESILQKGFRIVVHSSVPENYGVSSSAAIEVAVGHAVANAFKLKINNETMATLCQKAENLIVGAACGVMDQVATTYGIENTFTSFVCQPLHDIRSIPIPTPLAVWGLNSGISRNTSGSAYTNTRIGAFMGYRIISAIDNRKFEQKGPGLVTVEDEEWMGYLANIPPAIFEERYRPHIPTSISGREFLQKYHGSTDTIARIDPTTTYNVLHPTMHPIYENARIKNFISSLTKINDALSLTEYSPLPPSSSYLQAHLQQMGRWMYDSHESYERCGLGESHTTLLVDLVKQFGPSFDLYGAKITGGGGGGTVVVLGMNTVKAHNTLRQIQELYSQQTGLDPYMFEGSSMGASKFGCIVAQWM